MTRLLNIMLTKFKPKITERDVRLELLNPMQSLGNDILKDYKKTVATWDNKPIFTLEKKFPPHGQYLMINIYTESTIYRDVDLGKDRFKRIFPKTKQALKIPASYKAKTRRGFIGSMPGGESNFYFVRAWSTTKSIQARGFTETLEKKYYGAFITVVTKAMQKIGREAF